MSTFDVLTHFAAAFGTAYFGLIFIIALVYALLPSKRGAFDHASRIPMNED